MKHCRIKFPTPRDQHSQLQPRAKPDYHLTSAKKLCEQKRKGGGYTSEELILFDNKELSAFKGAIACSHTTRKLTNRILGKLFK